MTLDRTRVQRSYAGSSTLHFRQTSPKMSCDLVLSNFGSDHDVADLGDAIAHHLWQVILGQILFAVATFRQDQNSTAQSKQHLRMCRSEGLYWSSPKFLKPCQRNLISKQPTALQTEVDDRIPERAIAVILPRKAALYRYSDRWWCRAQVFCSDLRSSRPALVQERDREQVMAAVTEHLEVNVFGDILDRENSASELSIQQQWELGRRSIIEVSATPVR